MPSNSKTRLIIDAGSFALMSPAIERTLSSPTPSKRILEIQSSDRFVTFIGTAGELIDMGEAIQSIAFNWYAANVPYAEAEREARKTGTQERVHDGTSSNGEE